VVCTVSEYVMYAQELRLMVHDHAGVRRYRHFAVGECVKCIDGLVRRNIVRKMYQYVCLVRGQVIDLLDLDLALFLCLENGFDYSMSGFSERYLIDGQGILVYLLDFCTYLHHSTSLSLQIFGAVSISAGREVRIKFKILSLKMSHRCIDDLVEVVGKNLGCQTYGDTFSTLCKKERELDRQFHRFLITTVI